MSFRGGNRGGRGGFRGGFRGGRTGGARPFQQGPPDTVLEMGAFVHPCEGDIVCRSINTKVPYFNAPIYLENKTQVGKVDEILGPLNEVFFTIKCGDGVQATSFKEGDKFYIAADKLLPIERFLPKPKVAGPPKPKNKKKRGGAPGGRGGAPMGVAVLEVVSEVDLVVVVHSEVDLVVVAHSEVDLAVVAHSEAVPVVVPVVVSEVIVAVEDFDFDFDFHIQMKSSLSFIFPQIFLSL